MAQPSKLRVFSNRINGTGPQSARNQPLRETSTHTKLDVAYFPNKRVPSNSILHAEALKDMFPGNTEYLAEWYVPWILSKAASCTPSVDEIFPRLQTQNPARGTARGTDTQESTLNLLCHVAKVIRNGPRSSLNNIASALEDNYDTNIANGSASPHAVTAAAQRLNLLFSMVAWLTLMYEPEPPSSEQIFRIAACNGPSQYLSLSRPHTDASKKIPYFLKGFGMLLPWRQADPVLSDLHENPPGIIAKARSQPLNPETFNVKLLHTVGHLNVEWTDILSSHLHLDAETKRLQLFRFPSYCLASLPPKSSGAAATQQLPQRSVLHSCATDSNEAHWMQEWEVTEYLGEILQSYRLLFGQNKASRDFFDNKIRPATLGSFGYDPFLDHLCTSPHPVDRVTDRAAYPLPSTFPFLGVRLQQLKSYLDAHQPTSWRDLWKDRRDSAQWLTFWTVLIFGAISLLFSFIGTVAQCLQLWRSW